VPVADVASDLQSTSLAVDTMWVVVAAILVMFMQAGFAFLEMGFSRQKNVGAVVAKVLTNFAICGVVFWAVGFALGFGRGGSIIGYTGFALHYTDPVRDFPGLSFSDVGISAKWWFEFVFCAVSLAIVWGTTLERLKFGVYVIYAVIFSAVIYPLIAHWLFSGGWLAASLGSQDFAGSTVVHLTGATGGLAVLLLLGPRRGKFGPDGKPNVIPGHSMPFVGLATFILWFGWFGFNPGSTLSAISSTGQAGDIRFADIVVVTNIAAACGLIGALSTIWLRTRKLDIGMACNGAIAALVAITAPSGYVNPWAATIIGFVAGVIVVLAVLAIDKVLDDPVGALSAHGLAGIWGTLSCGIFTAPSLAKLNAVGDGGLWYTGSFHQLGAQVLGIGAAFGFAFASSFAIFWAIKKTIGMRVSAEDEEAGLDIIEHGMYGYPEQFIPAPEGPTPGFGAPVGAPVMRAPAAVPSES
jgi:Amt family ammonium transporter